MKAVVAVLLAAIAVAQANVCENQEDGAIPVYACKVFTRCQGGIGNYTGTCELKITQAKSTTMLHRVTRCRCHLVPGSRAILTK